MSGGAIWLASYPKSGNTWARLALMSLQAGGGSIDPAAINRFGNHNLERALMDRFLNIESAHLTDEEAEALRPEYNTAFFDRPEPRPCKTHEAWLRTGDGRPLFDASFTHSAIYLLRDPRDVAVSWSRFTGRSVDDAIAMMAEPDYILSKSPRSGGTQFRQRLSSWSVNVTSWVDESGLDPLVIRYEDMLADPEAALRRMAGHIGWDVSDEAIAGAAAATRFDKLADHERRHGFAERAAKTERFFHTGKSGGWRDVLSAGQATQIARGHGAVMERFGYR